MRRREIRGRISEDGIMEEDLISVFFENLGEVAELLCDLVAICA
jgi:hypothetical protein